jgi:hypothetical protein
MKALVTTFYAFEPEEERTVSGRTFEAIKRKVEQELDSRNMSRSERAELGEIHRVCILAGTRCETVFNPLYAYQPY